MVKRSTTVSTTVEREIKAISFAAFKEEFLSKYAGKSKAYLWKIKDVMKEIDSIGITSTSDLTPLTIGRFVALQDAKGRMATTKRVELQHVKTICNYAERYGFLDRSPFHDHPISSWVPPGTALPKRRFNPHEIKELLDYLESVKDFRKGKAFWNAARLWALVGTLAYLGELLTDTLRIRIENVDLYNSRAYITPQRSPRNGRPRTVRPVEIPKPLIPILKEWLSVRVAFCTNSVVPCPWLFPTYSFKAPWVNGRSGQRPTHRVLGAAAAAGVPGLGPDAIRRSIMAPWWEVIATPEQASQSLLQLG